MFYFVVILLQFMSWFVIVLYHNYHNYVSKFEKIYFDGKDSSQLQRQLPH